MPDEEPKTKDDIKQLLKHLEEEHRKANISDKTYKELKEKYKSQMSYMDNSVADENAQPMEEIEPEQAAAQSAAVSAPVSSEEEGEEKKGGLFGKILGKKKSDSPMPAPPPPTPSAEPKDSAAMIEIEKIKTMLDAVRDQKKSTDESIQSLFESIGEVRSMSIQNDTNEREMNSKLDKIMDDITNLRPKEVEKKFNQLNENMEKYQISMEKLQAKATDMAERLNKLSDLTKVIGNTENLANINENVQRKLSDIQEATNYTERLASKVEKMYIDMKMELEDIVIYKSKQEGMDEAMKDILKTLDAINTKFDSYTTKKDMENERQDIMMLGKETESIKNALAIVQTSVPEPILKLRKEREDINIFLDSLEEQHKTGKLNLADYQTIKVKNMEKLKMLNEGLEREWKNFERLVSQAKSLPPSAFAAPATQEPVQPEAATEEVTPEKPREDGTGNDEPAAEEESSEENTNSQESEEPPHVDKEKNLIGKVIQKEDNKEMMSDIKAEMEDTSSDEPLQEEVKEKKPKKKEPPKKKPPENIPF